MHHLPEAKDAVELAKVGGIGVAGFFASIQLVDVNTFVTIMVGLATFGFVVTKSVFMVIDRKERKQAQWRRRMDDLD